jgi:hypothetical protein
VLSSRGIKRQWEMYAGDSPATALPRKVRAAASRQWIFALCMVSRLAIAASYRVYDPMDGPPSTSAYFAAYDAGFTGRAGDATSARSTRVNPGTQFSLAQPNIYRGVLPRRECSYLGIGALTG